MFVVYVKVNDPLWSTYQLAFNERGQSLRLEFYPDVIVWMSGAMHPM